VNPELERKLVDKYPRLFMDSEAAQNRPQTTFGFECADGWFDLIDTLCARLSALDPIDEDEGIQLLRTIQIKEKYGAFH
jgi:hypothetical protein